MQIQSFGQKFFLAFMLALSGCASNDVPSENSVQEDLLTREYDEQLNQVLLSLMRSSEIDSSGSVILNNALTDRRFLEPNSGRYWQISGGDREPFVSRSLQGRTLKVSENGTEDETYVYRSSQFPNEPLRVVERVVKLSGSEIEWRFVVARALN